jgi:hypothetical protein
MRDYLKLDEIEEVLSVYFDDEQTKRLMEEMKIEAETCLCFAYNESECTCGAWNDD